MLVLLALPLLAVPAAVTPPAPAPDTVSWSAEGELLYTNVSGNTQLSLLTTGLDLKREAGDDYELELAGLARYGRSEGDVSVENYAGAAQVRLKPTGVLSPYAAVNYTRDPIKNLRVRWSARGGVQANLVRTDPDRRVAVGLALLRDYESRLLPEGSTEPEEVKRTRFNTSLALKWPLRDGVVVESRNLFEPATRDLSDYLIVSRTSLRVTLTRVVGFQASFTFERDNTPPPGVLYKNDRTLGVGLLLTLS